MNDFSFISSLTVREKDDFFFQEFSYSFHFISLMLALMFFTSIFKCNRNSKKYKEFIFLHVFYHRFSKVKIS